MDNFNELNIRNEQDFQLFMNNLEDELKKDEIPIRNRPMHAWDRVSSKLTFGLPFTTSKKEPKPNSFSGEDLSIRIFQWFEKKYGDRLNVDYSWKLPILIRDDIYLVKLPLVMGSIKINVFKLIEGITEDYIKSFNEEEIKSIVTIVEFGSRVRNNIESKYEVTLVNQAIGDIEASTSHLIAQSPQYGLAKWAALQASEKVLKAYIQKKGASFPNIHNLTKLAELAESLGLKQVPRNSLDKIQCEAGVRYGNPVVSKIEAMLAHYNSLSVCLFVTQQF